jgi:polyferredoxin
LHPFAHEQDVHSGWCVYNSVIIHSIPNEAIWMRVLYVPLAIILFVVVSLISQAIAFSPAEKTVMFSSGMLLVGAFIILAFK